MTADDPYRLARFVEAQDAGGAFENALDELHRGRKTSHWMWFVFPQYRGARPLADVPLLRHLVTRRGPRLPRAPGPRPPARRLCGRPRHRHADWAAGVLGELDAQKLRSSMTLFARAAPDEPVFQQVLDRQFAGQADPATDRLV